MGGVTRSVGRNAVDLTREVVKRTGAGYLMTESGFVLRGDVPPEFALALSELFTL